MRSHQALKELAERQHGVVSFRQLRELDFSKGKVSRSYGAFRLVRIHRGVYAVGQGRISDQGRCMGYPSPRSTSPCWASPPANPPAGWLPWSTGRSGAARRIEREPREVARRLRLHFARRRAELGT